MDYEDYLEFVYKNEYKIIEVLSFREKERNLDYETEFVNKCL